MRSSIFKRLVKAIGSAILTRRDVRKNNITVRGCNILYRMQITDGNVGDEVGIFKVIRQHNIRTKRKPRITNIPEKKLRIRIIPVKKGGGVRISLLTTQPTTFPRGLNLITNDAFIIRNGRDSTIGRNEFIRRRL